MLADLPNLSDHRDYWIRNARVPACLVDGVDSAHVADGLATLDMRIEDGRIAAVRAAAATPPSGPATDLDHGMIWPAFVDLHTHIDKGHIWPRRPNPDGSFAGALEAVEADRLAYWTADDVRRRMEFSLACAHAHGTAAMRTHLDSLPDQYAITWPVFGELRDAWRGRVDLQGAALVGIDRCADRAFLSDLVAEVARHEGIMGAVTYMIPELADGLKNVFEVAADKGLDLDFHADETGDPGAVTLDAIAQRALETGFDGTIVVGHCCSLARQATEDALHTLDKVARAGIAVISLPMCNMYLQDRQPDRTPGWRGVTLVHEMRARDIPVVFASDNTRDPFYAYGDLDMVEVFREATRIAHLDHPVGDWPEAVTRTPGDIFGGAYRGRLVPGAGADFVAFNARNWTELLARPQSDRIVVRAGRALTEGIPDYRQLDRLMRA